MNLIASISLIPDRPIIGWEYSDDYVDGVIFSHYIDNMNYPLSVTHDIIDGASFHKASGSNEKRKKIAVPECYENQGVIEDFVPKGYPEYNPVEQLFGWLKGYLRTNALKWNNGIWTKESIRVALDEAKSKVTHEMVKGWYRNTFSHMHPDKLVPLYLKAQDE